MRLFTGVFLNDPFLINWFVLATEPSTRVFCFGVFFFNLVNFFRLFSKELT